MNSLYSMNSGLYRKVVLPLWTYFLWYSAPQEEGVSSAIPVTQTAHWAGEPTVAQIGETETKHTTSLKETYTKDEVQDCSYKDRNVKFLSW